MKHKESFKTWLPNNKVNSVNDYLSYIKNASKAVDMPIDKFFDEVIEKAIDEKMTLSMYKNKDFTREDINNSKSAVRKYWMYLKDKSNL